MVKKGSEHSIHPFTAQIALNHLKSLFNLKIPPPSQICFWENSFEGKADWLLLFGDELHTTTCKKYFFVFPKGQKQMNLLRRVRNWFAGSRCVRQEHQTIGENENWPQRVRKKLGLMLLRVRNWVVRPESVLQEHQTIDEKCIGGTICTSNTLPGCTT